MYLTPLLFSPNQRKQGPPPPSSTVHFTSQNLFLPTFFQLLCTLSRNIFWDRGCEIFFQFEVFMKSYNIINMLIFLSNICQSGIDFFLTRTGIVFCIVEPWWCQFKVWKYGFIKKEKFELHLWITNKTITKLLYFSPSSRHDPGCCLQGALARWLAAWNLVKVLPEYDFSNFAKFVRALCGQMSQWVSQWVSRSVDWG